LYQYLYNHPPNKTILHTIALLATIRSNQQSAFTVSDQQVTGRRGMVTSIFTPLLSTYLEVSTVYSITRYLTQQHQNKDFNFYPL